MIAGHSYRVRLTSSIPDTSWIPAVFLAHYPQTEILSSRDVTPTSVDLDVTWQINEPDIPTGVSFQAEIPGFPGPSASATLVSFQDLGVTRAALLKSTLAFGPYVGSLAILVFVLWATSRLDRKRSK